MNKVYAIDFDGYLCKNAWPNIGKPIKWRIRRFKRLRKKGVKLILWTCRVDNRLKEAIDFCRAYGLEFDAVNENLPERIELYKGDCRKLSVDRYYDDKNGWI